MHTKSRNGYHNSASKTPSHWKSIIQSDFSFSQQVLVERPASQLPTGYTCFYGLSTVDGTPNFKPQLYKRIILGGAKLASPADTSFRWFQKPRDQTSSLLWPGSVGDTNTTCIQLQTTALGFGAKVDSNYQCYDGRGCLHLLLPWNSVQQVPPKHRYYTT